MTNEVRKRKRGEVTSKDLNIFEWNIANFAQTFESTKDSGILISPVFVGKSSGLPNTFWQIKLPPKAKDDNGKEQNFDIYLVFCKLLNKFKPVVRTSYEFTLLNGNQRELCKRETQTEMTFGIHHSHAKGFKMASHSQLFNRDNGFLEDDVLRIRIKLWINNEEPNGTPTKSKREFPLQKDFSQLLETSQFSDVDIEVEDCTLKAYKGILSCRSPVFSAMFQNDMAESRTSTVKITDFSSKTVKGMLQFIYSGNKESVKEDFMELLKIAEKYELKELKFACTKAAILKISVENVMELLILGDMYNAPVLKYRAMAFINSNRANPMFAKENEVFEKFAEEHPKLLLEMYKNVRNFDVDVYYSGESNETLEEVTRFTTNVKL